MPHWKSISTIMNLKIFYTVLWNVLFLAGYDGYTIFDIVRAASGLKDGVEPYVPVNYFANKNLLCFFAYCWDRAGKCMGSSYQCCECQCKSSKTFFSSSTSCYSGAEMTSAMNDVVGMYVC